MEERETRKKGKKIWVGILIVLAVLLLAGGAAAAYYYTIARETLGEITDADDVTSVVSVYVLTEDTAKNLKDLKEETFGIAGNSADDAELAQTAAKLEDKLGRAPEIRSYDHLFALADALKTGEVRAALLHDVYVPAMAEAQGYEWMENGVRTVASFAWEQEREDRPDEEIDGDARELPETFALYISGIDTFGSVAVKSRSDVNILAVVNTRTKKILMLATPRDFYVDFAVTGGSKDKLTHAGMYGVEQSVDALERLYDIDIDYYLRMNFSGFVDIIDALGGVDVYSEHEFSVQNVRTYQKGWNRLSGIEALAFARERYSFARGDYQRAVNQMEVIRAVLTKMASTSVLKNYRAVMRAVSDSFETNMPEEQIMEFVRMEFLERPQWEIETFTTQGSDTRAQTYSMPGQNLYVIIPDEESVRQAKEKVAQTFSRTTDSDSL